MGKEDLKYEGQKGAGRKWVGSGGETIQKPTAYWLLFGRGTDLW